MPYAAIIKPFLLYVCGLDVESAHSERTFVSTRSLWVRPLYGPAGAGGSWRGARSHKGRRGGGGRGGDTHIAKWPGKAILSSVTVKIEHCSCHIFQ